MAARPARKTGSGINRPMTRWRPCEFDRSFSQLRMGLFKVAAEAAALVEALLDKHLQPLEDQLRKVQGPLEDMICEFLKQQQLTGELEARVQAAEESLFQAHKALEACQEERYCHQDRYFIQMQIMAAANPAESLRDEASCSICLDYFTDPVTIDCGHNFCRSCITQSWEGRDRNFPCPQCRETSQQRNLRPNRHLANMTEMMKKLSQCSVRPKEENLCEEHEEKLKLFCEEDQKIICLICRESRDHRSHTVSPIKEAVQEYKEKLKMHLEPLRKNLEDLLKFKSTEEKKAEELKSETQIKRQKVESEFEELQQFLNKEKQILLSRLEKEEKKILQRIMENETQLEEQSSSLMQLITEIEEKSQQPTNELLKDVKDALSRCEKMKFLEPEVVSTDLKMGFQLSYPQQLKKWITKFG
ncbi:E3 ubiquitin-protein ligase TRIM39-like, partial [Microcaecilia unicolor]|uniref:RING-type E3 ubiquitin transferase n=1 Tax=Microcaecilia unicolor TaxID=1415580 RepID=A0A6P7WVU1_9AMPH